MILEHRRQFLMDLYHDMLQVFGPQHWWPAETPFEVIVGAILTQNAAWKNVTKAIKNLKEEGLCNLDAMHAANPDKVRQLIRPSGYYNQKARRLLNFCRHIVDQWQGHLDRFLEQPLKKLRRELLTLNGIGPETADSILLYAAGKPIFVVDAYTHRIFFRHGCVPEKISYDELQNFFMDCLEPDVEVFQEFHALLVRLGHEFCSRRKRCDQCPPKHVFDLWSM